MKRYFIVGASSGVGQKLSELLTQAGNETYGTYHTHNPENYPANVHFHQLDVMADTINTDFLPDTLDGLVYCPGSINLKPFERISGDDFLKDYQLQVLGAVRILQVALPRLKKSPFASVVLFSTVAAQVGLTFHSQVSASKGAVEGLVKALAAEYAPKIRINAIAPSLTDTPLAASLLNNDQKREANAQRHPLKKIGTPEDIAHMAEFLLSEKSKWITGQIIHVDGGMSTLKI